MKINEKESRTSRVTSPQGRRIMWIMIPVLMAMILILNQTRTEPPRLPAALEGIRVLAQSNTQRVSLIVASETTPTADARDFGNGFWAVRVADFESAGLFDVRAVAALGYHVSDVLAAFDTLASPVAGSARLSADFPEQVLARELGRDADFASAKARLVEQFRNALREPDSALRLLERMALEGLPPNWHLLVAQRLDSISEQEFIAWQTRSASE